MPLITETYYLSLTQDNRGILRLRCSQDDTLRTVNLKLYNNGSIFVIPNGISASVSGVKQNGEVFSKSCTISQDRQSAVLQLSSDITNVDGIIIAEIVLSDGNGGRLGTSNFVIQVEKNPILAGVVQDTETPIEYINDFITQIQALTARVNNLITPSGDPSLAEVVDARISSLDGNTYQNLKARIDADIATLNTRKANKSEVYTKSQVDDLLTNIEIDVDDELSDESENPVQNKIVAGAISMLHADLDTQADNFQILSNRVAILDDMGLVPFAGHFITQGGYATSGLPNTRADRIRVSDFVPVRKGDVLTFSAGIETTQVLIGIFDIHKVYKTERGWYSNGKEFEFTDDGFAIILFRKDSSNPNITPSMYDAETRLVPAWKIPMPAIFSEDVKAAILACFANVAWTTNNGQEYYDTLNLALNPQTSLVSISATFNPGSAIIYDTTPVSDLKAYLTVTGLYNDGTTKTVRDYSLSGSLTAGISTITITKDGKTATFNANVVYHWDCNWDYTQGMPENSSGFSLYTSAGTASMESDGFVITAENTTDKSYRYKYAPSDTTTLFNKCIIEWRFVLVSWGSYNTAPYMNGIRINPGLGNRDGNRINSPGYVLNRSGVTAWQPTTDNQWNHDVIAAYSFEIGTEYTLRLEYDVDKCKIYINGELVATEGSIRYAENVADSYFGVSRGASIKMKSYKERLEV